MEIRNVENIAIARETGKILNQCRIDITALQRDRQIRHVMPRRRASELVRRLLRPEKAGQDAAVEDGALFSSSPERIDGRRKRREHARIFDKCELFRQHFLPDVIFLERG